MPLRTRNNKSLPDMLKALEFIAAEPRTIEQVAIHTGRGSDAARGWLTAMIDERWIVMRGHRFTPHKRGPQPVLYEAGPRLLKLMKGAP